MGSASGDSGKSRSVLDPYCTELQRLASTLCGVLDVAERRSDLTAEGDADALSRLTGIVADLARRFERFRATLPVRGAAPQGSARDHAGAPPAIETLAAPAVQASLAETMTASSTARRQEFLQWLEAAPKPGGKRAAGPGAPRGGPGVRTGPAGGSPPTLGGAQGLLAALTARVGVESPMKGTIDSMPIPRVFELLVRLQRTGCLHVRTAGEHLRFVLVEGMIVATATDNQPQDQRLGELLRHLGLIPRRHLQTLVERAEREQRPLGALLVDEQLVSIAQLTRALTIQVQARFERAFKAKEGAYLFVPDSGQRVDDRLRVDARALLADLGEPRATPTTPSN